MDLKTHSIYLIFLSFLSISFSLTCAISISTLGIDEIFNNNILIIFFVNIFALILFTIGPLNILYIRYKNNFKTNEEEEIYRQNKKCNFCDTIISTFCVIGYFYCLGSMYYYIGIFYPFTYPDKCINNGINELICIEIYIQISIGWLIVAILGISLIYIFILACIDIRKNSLAEKSIEKERIRKYQAQLNKQLLTIGTCPLCGKHPDIELNNYFRYVNCEHIICYNCAINDEYCRICKNKENA